MTLAHPYIIYGTIKIDGIIQAGVNVTVRNNTKVQEHTVQTDSTGYFNVTITRTDWYASGVDNGDIIKVTAVDMTVSATVNDSTYPFGLDMGFNVLQQTKTYSVDTLLKKMGLTLVASSDALLSKMVPKTITSDTMLQKVNNLVPIVGDTFFCKTLVSTMPTDNLLQKTLLKTLLNDTLLQKLVAKYLDIDTLLLDQYSTDFNVVFTAIKKNVAKTFGTDGLLLKATSQTMFINVLLRKLNLSKTMSVGTLFRKLNMPICFDADPVLRGSHVATFSADVATRSRVLISINTNVLLKKLDLTKTMSVNTMLRKLGSKSFSVDTSIGMRAILQFAIDSLLLKANQLKTFGIDVLAIKKAIHTCLDADTVLGGSGRVRMIDGDALLLLKNLLRTASIDVQLYKQYMQVFSTDSFIRKVLTTALLLDTLIQYKNLLTALSVDILLSSKDLPTKYFSIDALIRSLETIVTEADVLVRKTISSSFSADTTLRGDYWLKNVDVDVRLLKRLTATADIDCFTQQVHTISFNTDLTLIKQSTLALLVGTLLKKTGCTSGFSIDTSCGKYTPVATRLVLTAAWFEPLSITIAAFESLSLTASETNPLTIECEEL